MHSGEQSSSQSNANQSNKEAWRIASPDGAILAYVYAVCNKNGANVPQCCSNMTQYIELRIMAYHWDDISYLYCPPNDIAQMLKWLESSATLGN